MGSLIHAFGKGPHLAGAALLVCQLALAAENWPQFRGPDGRAVAEGSPPVIFAPSTNVLWQRDFPSGSSSPIIWEDRLFLTGFEKASP